MKIKTMSKIGLSAICLAGMVASANATPVTPLFSLCTGNSDISGFAGPYGSVDVLLTSPTTATITFTSSSVGGHEFLFGAQGVVAVNVNATSWTVSTPTELNAVAGFTPGPASNGGSAQENGFGVFNQTFDNFDGYTHSADTVSFILTDTSGTWTSAANVLTANASGYTVAAHIFVAASSPANPSVDALATGYAAGCPITAVPDGGTTAALLGLGMLGLGSVRRFLSKK